MSKRKLQELYNQHRELESQFIKTNQQIKNILNFDLVQKKKITFNEVTFEEWLKNSGEKEFWIFNTDDFSQMGMWKGLNELSKEDREHFDEYVRDYFYYGKPNYVDANGDECTECELAFEGGCSLTCLRRTNM